MDWKGEKRVDSRQEHAHWSRHVVTKWLQRRVVPWMGDGNRSSYHGPFQYSDSMIVVNVWFCTGSDFSLFVFLFLWSQIFSYAFPREKQTMSPLFESTGFEFVEPMRT